MWDELEFADKRHLIPIEKGGRYVFKYIFYGDNVLSCLLGFRGVKNASGGGGISYR